MQRRCIINVLVSLTLLAGHSTFAQETPGSGNVGRMYFSKPMPGHVAEYIEAIKKHNDFHRSKGDSWTWNMFEIVSGAESGQYLIGTWWHQWSDFDNPPVSAAEDNADYLENIVPHEASWKGEHVIYMPDHSYPPEDMSVQPLYVVYRVKIKPVFAEAYLNAIKKFPEAARKAGVNLRYFFWRVADGGTVPSFYISVPFSSWADRGEQGTPFEEILTKAYGRGEAHAILHTFDKATAYETNMVLEYRPELSYVPESD